jgi:hypothetical protein
MTTLTENPHAGGFLLSEANGNRSRDNGTLNSPMDLQAGTVLGAKMAAGAAVAGTNTGNGSVTVGALGEDAQLGTYTLKCVAAAANAGTFQLIAPNGLEVREITVGGGAAANDHVTITVADGATDFVAGDSFTVAVTLDSWEQLNTSATNGTQTAAGILYAAVDATAADKPCVVIARAAEVNGNELIWPASISAGNKANAIAALKALGILVR